MGTSPADPSRTAWGRASRSRSPRCRWSPGFAVMFVADHPWAIAAGALLMTNWEPLSVPATFDIVGSEVPKNRRTTAFAVQSIQKRLPKVIGPAIGGLAFGAIGYWLNLTLAFALVGLADRPATHAAVAHAPARGSAARAVPRHPRLHAGRPSAVADGRDLHSLGRLVRARLRGALCGVDPDARLGVHGRQRRPDRGLAAEPDGADGARDVHSDGALGGSVGLAAAVHRRHVSAVRPVSDLPGRPAAKPAPGSACL